MTAMRLVRVQYLPKQLDPGVLYVSEEFAVAGHLCACGCGAKVITPLGKREWSFTAYNGKASLYPSIGNWQLPCRSHYWIADGRIKWSGQWTEAEIQAGYDEEERLRKLHYDGVEPGDSDESFFKRLLKRLFGR